MKGKVFYLTSTIFFLWVFQCIQFSNADVYCHYRKGNGMTMEQKWCEYTCCSQVSASENTACCGSTATSRTSLSFIAITRYQFWTYLLCVVCLFTAFCILTHYIHRICFRMHSKYFNPVVAPQLAFTISKKDLDIPSGDVRLILEENPPSYPSCISPPPPPYFSIDYQEKKLRE